MPQLEFPFDPKLTFMSAGAGMMDGALSLADPYALDIRTRVERWSLDEVALPGKLVHEIVEQLYRDNLLCQGTLKVNGAVVGPSALSAPKLAVMNIYDEIASPSLRKSFAKRADERACSTGSPSVSRAEPARC